jgi:hypothetical protein
VDLQGRLSYYLGYWARAELVSLSVLFPVAYRSQSPIKRAPLILTPSRSTAYLLVSFLGTEKLREARLIRGDIDNGDDQQATENERVLGTTEADAT